MTEPIKLPPLPEPVATVKRTMSALTYKHKTSIGLSIGENDLVTVAQAQAYATAAIKAARQEVKDEQQCSDFWAWIRHAYREPESVTYTVYNMEVAYQAGRTSVEADRKRRGEPVVVPTKTQIDDAMCKVSMPFFPDETREGTDWIIQQFVKELWEIAAPQPQQIPPERPYPRHLSCVMARGKRVE